MIEDSDEDFVAAERAFKKTGFELQIKRTINATDALAFLNADGQEIAGKPATGDVPALILLDLNLPGMDGRELLIELKENERLKQIPVVVLTTSSNPQDITYCYQHGVNSYHIKSIGFEKFSASMNSMLSYWFKNVMLPSSIN